VVDIEPKGSDVLGGRATLLANLMMDGEIKATIAQKAGLRPNALKSADAAPGTDGPPNPRAFMIGAQVLTTSRGDLLPIIEVDTQAPDAAGAQRVADAAVAGLRDYLSSKAAGERVSSARRLRISALNQAQSRLAVRGPRMAFGVAATLFCFIFGCAAILMGAALVRGLRADPADLAARRTAVIAEDPDDLVLPETNVPWPPGKGIPEPAMAADAVNGGNGVRRRRKAEAHDKTPADPAPQSASSWWAGGPV
jgi:hypothetical protein